jgi:hypothetical protein
MKTVAVEDTDLTAKELAEMAKDEMVILTRKGNPLVAVKDLSGSDWESVALANNPKFVAIIEASRRSYRERGGISLDQIRKEFGLKPKRKTVPKPPRRKTS